jgi:hypothetical protein
MVEMHEAANILNNATSRSLLLIDELGRGTSTFDGLSIAWAIVEYLHQHREVHPRTLFATHYHEMTELESHLERVVNFNVQVREEGGRVVFLHRGRIVEAAPLAELLARLAGHTRIEVGLEDAALFERTLRDSAPAHRLLTALEIRHPAIAHRPVRVVNDTEDRRIEGRRYVALRFDAKLVDDVDGQVPQAELAIDNIGRELTQWIEAAGGGVVATVRVLQVLDIDNPPVEWELTLDLAGVQVDSERVTARLGFDPLLGRAAVVLRHDPQTSPGLF